MQGNRASVSLEHMPLNSHLPAARGVWGKAPAHGFVSSEWGSLPRNTETGKPLQENEGTTEPSLLQCLYVQPPAGKGCHHVPKALGVIDHQLDF